eukprot:7037683-Alexandrium_andersonii.AAC.1
MMTPGTACGCAQPSVRLTVMRCVPPAIWKGRPSRLRWPGRARGCAACCPAARRPWAPRRPRLPFSWLAK